jgi:hypothetical protein
MTQQTFQIDGGIIKELLSMLPKTIGAPLLVSGDRKHCPNDDRAAVPLKHREINWLDIVSSALDQLHNREMTARVILGKQQFVNTEAPRAIADLKCFKCKTAKVRRAIAPLQLHQLLVKEEEQLPILLI